MDAGNLDFGSRHDDTSQAATWQVYQLARWRSGLTIRLDRITAYSRVSEIFSWRVHEKIGAE
jgi:hypothetical protein